MASAGSSSSLGDVGGVVSTPAPTSAPVPRTSVLPSSSGDTCGCHASGSPRSCYECLNIKLQSGDSCVVTPLGLCMSSSSAAGMQSFFNSTFSLCASARNCSIVMHSNQNFGSSSSKYCEATDASCASCRATWLDAYEMNLMRDTTNFLCAGIGGCICTAYCELREADDISLPSAYDTGGEYCSAIGSGSTFNVNTVMNSIALIGSAVLMAFLLRSGITQFRLREFQINAAARRRAERIQRIVARSSQLTLNLEGWNSYREKLIGRELQDLGLKTDALLSEAPSAVIVEEGEGFRPVSPSQHARHSAHAP